MLFRSCLETDVSIEREWRTTLQKEKEALVSELELIKLQLKKVPSLEKVTTHINQFIRICTSLNSACIALIMGSSGL